MSDFHQLHKRQHQILLIVIINFALYLVLFAGLGYVTWQSVVLVNRLKADLESAEQTVAELQDRFRTMDLDAVVDRLVGVTSERLGASIERVVAEADLGEPMRAVTANVDAASGMIEETRAAVRQIDATVAGLDNEEIARLVSYQILQGLGDGFQAAAAEAGPEAAAGGERSDR